MLLEAEVGPKTLGFSNCVLFPSGRDMAILGGTPFLQQYGSENHAFAIDKSLCKHGQQFDFCTCDRQDAA